MYVRHQVRRQVVTLLRVSSEGTQAAYTTRDCSVRSGPFRENLKDAVKVKDNTYNVPSIFNGKYSILYELYIYIPYTGPCRDGRKGRKQQENSHERDSL